VRDKAKQLVASDTGSGRARAMSKRESITDIEDAFARRVDWNLFKFFHEIARSGGVGAAARLLNKQQPSVSAALKRLEQQIGAKLCIRTSRGIELTPAGRQLFSCGTGMYSLVQSASRTTTLVDRDYAGTVTLRVISNLVLPQFNAALSEFHRRHPRIEINLDVAPWRLVLKSLKSGDAELGIGFDGAPSHELNYLPLLEEVQQLYCGPQHPLYGCSSIPDKLRDETFVLAGREEVHDVARFRKRHGLGHRVGGIADNLSERMLLIKLGVGIGFLPEAVVASSAASQDLWPLLSTEVTPTCTIYFMSRANCEHSAPAQLLMESVLSQVRREPVAAVNSLCPDDHSVSLSGAQ